MAKHQATKCPTCAQIITTRCRKDRDGRLVFHCVECQPDLFDPVQQSLDFTVPARAVIARAPVRKDLR